MRSNEYCTSLLSACPKRPVDIGSSGLAKTQSMSGLDKTQSMSGLDTTQSMSERLLYLLPAAHAHLQALVARVARLSC